MIFPSLKKSLRPEEPFESFKVPDKKGAQPGKEKSALLEPANIIFIMAIIIAVTFLITTRRENQKLRTRIAVLGGTLAGPPEAQPGDIVPSFNSVNLESQRIDIAFDHVSKHLFYIFSPGCGECITQFPDWNRLAATAKSKNLPVLGISIDGLEESQSRLNHLAHDFDIAIMPNQTTQRAYRVVAVPEILLVSADGVVEWCHYGGLTKAKIEELTSKMENISTKSSQ